MALLYNPYKLTDTEIFGSNTNYSIAIGTIANRWLDKTGLTNLGTIKSTDKAAIGGVLAKIGQLPKLILTDAGIAQSAMISIETGLKAKYILSTNVRTNAFGLSMYNYATPAESYNNQRKAIVTQKDSDGGVIFKYNGQNYLYWAAQYRLIALATESVRSKLIPLGITLPV